ncbi:MAG: hypothetical protein SF097_13250 [Acidobacteriota bacterium]|nr:hypothetical protein [Acidobacteriota bacterium]
MRSPFYQGNFCSECGNPLSPRFQILPRHFCDECAARLRQRSYLTPLAGVLLAASVAVFALNYKTGEAPNRQQPAAAPVVSAQDSVINRSLKPATIQSSSKVLCGARTRRGTPCRHLVEPGERCAQHKGKPSLLANEQESKTP